MSDPCCISVPIANHKELINENWFSRMSESLLHGCGFSHSYGLNLYRGFVNVRAYVLKIRSSCLLNLARMKSSKDTPRKAVAVYTHTSNDSGDRNENRLGGCLCGFRYRIPIPVTYSNRRRLMTHEELSSGLGRISI